MRLAQKLAAYFLFVVLTHSGGALGQTRLFTSYTKADGLPSDYVLRIYQSPEGFMWFGTERGAARYDGERFTLYNSERGLPHNMVYDILEDAQGRTWFATPSPTLTFSHRGTIQSLPIDSGSDAPMNALGMDGNNRVFFRFQGGIGILNGDNYAFHPIRLDVSKESSLERLHDGRIIFSDSRHVFASRLDSGTDLRYDTLLTLPKPFTFIVIDQAPDSSIYITSNEGVTRYGLQHNRMEEIETFMTGFNTTISVLSNEKVVLGSRVNGLTLLDNGVISPLPTSSGNDRKFTSSQLVDYEGNLWIGFFGQGVEKLSTWNAVIYTEEDGLDDRNIWRVTTHRGDPLALSLSGIQRIRQGRLTRIEGMPSYAHTVRGIEFTNNRVFIGTMSNLFVLEYDPRLDKVGKLVRQYDMGDGVNDLEMAQDGSLWIANAGMRLFRLMPDGIMTSYPVRNGVERLVRAGRAMWALTTTEGAIRYENESVRQVSKQTGELPSDEVWSLHEDEHGILIGTSAGLTHIGADGSFSRYDATNGVVGTPVVGIFPTPESSKANPSYWVVTPNHVHQFIDGALIGVNSLAAMSTIMAGTHWVEPSPDRKHMYLASSSGLVIYDLTQNGRSNPAPKVSIRGVIIGTQWFENWADTDIRVTSSSSTLEFDFVGLTFIKESETRFSYKLSGIDNEWSAPQGNRTVRYANIPPGTYTFQVRSINIDGQASTEAATLRVVIQPPFWMHPLILALLFIAVLAALVAVARWRVRVIRAEIVKRNEQKQFEAIQRIGASISHDIKNTVFSLSLLSKNLEKRFDNPEFRKDAIETIESSLTYLSTLVNRLQKTTAHEEVIRRDVSVHALCANLVKRVLGGSDRHVDMDIPDTMRMNVNPEPVERILENLIRNALEATTPEQHVRVSAQQIGAETEIQVIDQGTGMSDEFVQHRLFKPFQSTKTKGLGIGLYSCKELADAMGATIQVDSQLGMGTTFRLRFVTFSP